jgi:murein DD-endopeptidase MepM/ murein hydrolase activator NlpD
MSKNISSQQTPDNNPGSSTSQGGKLVSVLVNLLLVILVGTAAILAYNRFVKQGTAASGLIKAPKAEATRQEAAPETEFASAVALAPLENQFSAADFGISRLTLLDTLIPNRPRVEVITYTVQTGESLFSIADQFSLKPETVLWGNFETLQDNPHLLKPEQVLNILPINGTYYQWNENDNLNHVAAFFNVDPETIIEYPGNNIDLTALQEGQPAIEPGSWLIIPDGKRALKDWGPPAISRTNPASARFYGAGHCGSVYEGAIGNGTFIWPTTDRTISGYTYNGSVHPAVDIGGSIGNAIFATDGGVVVYSGWSDYGYGYLIVIDHGNGWQSAYAHLSSVGVGCGQSVFQGNVIGGLGSTGNSSGPHLHFELVINGAKVNPLDFIR